VRYDRVITTHLQRSSFGECDATPPPAPPPLPPPDVPDGQSRAGVSCTNDDACDSDTLVCFTGGPGIPTCSAACQNDRDIAVEEAACGGTGGTCVSPNDMAPLGSCAQSCQPDAARGSPGSCPPHQVCTGFWFSHSAGPDRPGCSAFCRDDRDCIRGTRCNPRLGACGPPWDPAGLLADGEPCRSDVADVQCRGGCSQLGTRPGEGICLSAIDFTVTSECPDDPMMRVLGTRATDSLGLCVFRGCTTDADCTAPLVCRFQAGISTNACQHPP
jgi:hypothetical protein